MSSSGKRAPFFVLLATLLLTLPGAARAYDPPDSAEPLAPPEAAPTMETASSTEAPEAPPGEAAQAAQTGGFETFTLPLPERPTRPGLAPPGGSLLPGGFPARPRLPGDHVRTQLALTLFPGMNDLSASVAGQINDKVVDGQISPLWWIWGDVTDPGYFQLAQGNRGARLGGAYNDLLGSAEGLRVFSPWRSGRATIGFGLYQRLRGGPSGGGVVPAIDNTWKLGENWDAGALLAADSSWRVTHALQKKRWQIDSFAGHDAHYSRQEGGVSFQAQPLRLTSISMRLVGWSGGELAGKSWSAGLNQKLGRSLLAFEQTRSEQSGARLNLGGVGLFTTLGKRFLSLRWQRVDLDQSAGGQDLRTSALFGTVLSPIDKKTHAWLTAAQTWSDAAPPSTLLSLGLRRQISDRWDVQAELTRGLQTSVQQLRASVGYRFSPDWQFRALYGPSLSTSSPGAPEHVFGAQIVRSLEFHRERAGSISGIVTIGGRPFTRPLTISLDGAEAAVTDRKGAFRIGHVPPGPHTVSISGASLPADMSAEVASVQVEVRNRRTARASFTLKRVGEIRGSVSVGPNAFGETDPTAGVGVVISAGDGHETTTNEEGEFVLGGLEAGKYRVRIEAGTIPPDFEVEGPAETEVDVDPDAEAPRVQFRIAPKKPIIEFPPETVPGSLDDPESVTDPAPDDAAAGCPRPSAPPSAGPEPPAAPEPPPGPDTAASTERPVEEREAVPPPCPEPGDAASGLPAGEAARPQGAEGRRGLQPGHVPIREGEVAAAHVPRNRGGRQHPARVRPVQVGLEEHHRLQRLGDALRLHAAEEMAHRIAVALRVRRAAIDRAVLDVRLDDRAPLARRREGLVVVLGVHQHPQGELLQVREAGRLLRRRVVFLGRDPRRKRQRQPQDRRPRRQPRNPSASRRHRHLRFTRRDVRRQKPVTRRAAQRVRRIRMALAAKRTGDGGASFAIRRSTASTRGNSARIRSATRSASVSTRWTDGPLPTSTTDRATAA
jgi:hypothetical protein